MTMTVRIATSQLHGLQDKLAETVEEVKAYKETIASVTREVQPKLDIAEAKAMNLRKAILKAECSVDEAEQAQQVRYQVALCNQLSENQPAAETCYETLRTAIAEAVRGKWADAWAGIVLDDLQYKLKGGGMIKSNLKGILPAWRRGLTAKQVDRVWHVLANNCVDLGRHPITNELRVGPGYECYVTDNGDIERARL